VGIPFSLHTTMPFIYPNKFDNPIIELKFEEEILKRSIIIIEKYKKEMPCPPELISELELTLHYIQFLLSKL
jgi:hypothetical protein